jgi:hypothetical protein
MNKTNESTRYTLEDFISKSNKVHNNKYDYSLVEYKQCKSKVEILCPIDDHGTFWQNPYNHMSGGGCTKYARLIIDKCRLLTTESFVEKSKKIHGDKYLYNKVVYINAKTKVDITCPIEGHGSFLQKPNSHLLGSGCPKCGKETFSKNIQLKKLDIKEQEKQTKIFIKKALDVHKLKGIEYDYSQVLYIDHNSKVEIICKKHKSFLQTPSAHLKGTSCPKCAIDNSVINNERKRNDPKTILLKTEKFIKKAKEVHFLKEVEYDYSKVVYLGNNTKIEIVCKKHGSFWQTPSNHLTGYACAECANVKVLTTETFIKRAKEVHGDKYDYSLVEYTKGKSNVKIICQIHKEFRQIAYSHLQGQGCKKCANNGTSKPEKQWLDFIGVPEEFRNYHMTIKGRKFCFDGIDFEKKIIFEFYGDYFHGNPSIYDHNVYNKFLKNTYGELYAKTMDKERYILENSEFSLVTIWEKDFRQKLKNGEIIIK